MRGIATLPGTERLVYPGALADYRPTIAAAAGSSNVSTAEIRGTDLAGYIIIGSAGGGATNTGAVVTVTFTDALIAGYGGGFEAGHRAPLVFLSPLTLAASPAGATSGAAGVTAGAYAIVSSTLTSFQVGVTTAIPAASMIAYAYRVTQT